MICKWELIDSLWLQMFESTVSHTLCEKYRGPRNKGVILYALVMNFIWILMSILRKMCFLNVWFCQWVWILSHPWALASLAVKNKSVGVATWICSCSKHVFLFWIKHTAFVAKFIQNWSRIDKLSDGSCRLQCQSCHKCFISSLCDDILSWMIRYLFPEMHIADS